jgi:crotonobetainyl-CoA:carnitine CoA-transferase CaiB-like acyl-CoA transferase
MMGLWEAQKTGRGQVIDCSQYEAVHATQGFQMPWVTGEGKVSGHSGNKAPTFQPYDTSNARTVMSLSGPSDPSFTKGCLNF